MVGLLITVEAAVTDKVEMALLVPTLDLRLTVPVPA